MPGQAKSKSKSLLSKIEISSSSSSSKSQLFGTDASAFYRLQTYQHQSICIHIVGYCYRAKQNTFDNVTTVT